MRAPLPEDERARIENLREFKVLDTEPEEVFDEITRLAALISQTPTALITFVDSDRQWFKSHFGFDVRETTRDLSFCAHAILQEGPTVVRDALDDERFRDNPLVTGEPYIRFYAGAPLVTTEGFVLGTLCVIDRRPRDLEEGQIKALQALSRVVIALFESRRERNFLRRALDKHKRAEEELKARLERRDQS